MSDDSAEHLEGPKAPAKAQPHWLNRFLWMGARVAEARAKTFGPDQPGFACFDLARRLCDDIIEVGQTGKSSLAVLLLECDQVGLLIRAHLEREGLASGAGPLGEAGWANALKVPVVAAALAMLTGAQIATLTELLGPGRDASLAKVTLEDREAFASAVHGLAAALSEPLEFEAYRLWRALFERWLRIGAAAVVVAVLLGVAGLWLDKKFSKPNIALHRPVTISSQYATEGKDHSLLVDGNRENIGFHTESGGQQWVVIDLGSVRTFNKVVVYNRVNCCQERATPMKLEVSKDNVTFKLLRERKETFDKWTAKGLHAEGRYVRLSNTPPNYFHLAEVEIY